ncbi:MAG: hypothetical protein HWE10_00235, partial [Gammaproteobacteria bacterium]|nr:hypothetical protein [Gammaproteobacteria bacterium]
LFNKQLAKFEVRAQLRDSLFRFSESWPAIENFNSEIVVDSRLMSINGQQGQFSAMTLNNDITAQIDLAAESTIVQLLLTPAEMQFKQFHQLIDNTPLNETIGDVFEFVRLDGDANATVQIAIPVSNDDPVNVQGTVITNNAKLDLPDIPLNFSELNAVVSFNNSEFSITADKGALFGLPVTFDVQGGEFNNDYRIQADLLGDWQHSDFVKHFPSDLNDYFSGNIASSINVRVNLEEDGYQYFVSGRSDLTQAEYEITQPLVKNLGEPASFNAFVVGDNEGHQLELSLEDDLFFQGRISTETGVFEQANLTVGSENSILPASGFDIRLELQQSEFEPTLNFVTDLIAYLNEGESSDTPIMPSPFKVSGNIQNLSILGQEWQNVSLDAKPQTDSWLFSIGAKQTLSEILVHDDIDNKGININSSFLHIEVPTDEEKELASALTPETNVPKEEATVAKPVEDELKNSAELIRTLPPISMICQDCKYNGKPLGTIELVTKTKDSELLIEKANMQFERNSVKLAGKWIGDEGAGITQLKGQINSRYFGDWLKNYELNTGIKDSDAKINLDVSWDKAPYMFGYETLSGKADFRLGEGYLSEVSDQGVRVVSWLSLDSLYRKLKFDFNDIFAKGLFYNDIRGDVVLKNGVAYSENIKMDGVAGNMDMSGFTDLNKDTLDYNVSFRPKLTSSLGVLSWLAAANPVTIIGAFALDKILEDADVLAEMRLKISGNLNKPVVKEVKRFTKKAEMPSKAEIEEFRQEYLQRNNGQKILNQDNVELDKKAEVNDKPTDGTEVKKKQSLDEGDN